MDGDEFFKEEGHYEDGNELDSGLAVAELSATAERFRTLGYHETYERTKDIRLQEGFEAGFRENFDVAMRVGELLGRAAMQAKVETPSNDADKKSNTRPLYLHAAGCIREHLTNESAEINLQNLEQDLNNMLNKHNTKS